MKRTKKKSNNHVIVYILYIFLGEIIILNSLLFWLSVTWHNLNVDEIMFHLSNPIEGTNKDVIYNALLYVIIGILVYVPFIFVLKKIKEKDFNKYIVVIYSIILFFLILFCFKLQNTVNLFSYVQNQYIDSTFIKKNYVSPEETQITFPDKKRNLIYIYLESMEVSYANKENGGGFDENYIPELTQLAKSNICFTDNDNINGAYSLYGTTWTMGGMFAESTGLPLKTNVYNSMEKQDDFFPNIVSIGDVLKEQGYNNEIIVGSDIVFGGREKFYKTHGDYSIFDYIYAKDNNYIPEDYYEFWGFEDEKLFEYAKQELRKLSTSKEPFNLTLLTVDTHFEDGYVCRLCNKEYGDNQYANVIRCSSRQVYDFVEWIKEQDFYDNTTIVLSGDHPTMDTDFCDSLNSDYQRRVYTAYINSPKEPINNTYRLYSTFDYFPTTISALGADISGGKLGLGVDLFSNEETIVERYGYDKCMVELSRKSDFYDELESVELTDELIQNLENESCININRDSENWDINVQLAFPVHSISLYKGLYIRYKDSNDKSKYTEKKIYVSDETITEYNFKINNKKIPSGKIDVQIVLKTNDKNEYIILSYYDIADSTDFETFLSQIDTKKYSVFISARDEAATNLSNEVMNKLHEMGINTQINIDGFRKSYYAIIVDGKVVEDLREDKLKIVGGDKRYNLEYEVISEGYDSGNYSSIIINNKEYSMNMRGLNIVLYDNEAKRVVKSVNYDTYLDSACRMMEVD